MNHFAAMEHLLSCKYLLYFVFNVYILAWSVNMENSIRALAFPKYNVCNLC